MSAILIIAIIAAGLILIPFALLAAVLGVSIFKDTWEDLKRK